MTSARLGPSRAVQLATQTVCNNAVRPNPPVQIGEVISEHIQKTGKPAVRPIAVGKACQPKWLAVTTLLPIA